MKFSDEKVLRDIITLFEVNPLHDMFSGKMFEGRVLFREIIAEHFEKKINVIPFPGKSWLNYHFRLFSLMGSEQDIWKPMLRDKDIHIPWDSVLPYNLIETVASHPVNSNEVVQLNDISYLGDTFHIYFIKYLDDAVVGIVQKMFRLGEKAIGVNRSYDSSQFMELNEEEQVEVFFRYFNDKPGLRRKILFHFFTTTLPSINIMEAVTLECNRGL